MTPEEIITIHTMFKSRVKFYRSNNILDEVTNIIALNVLREAATDVAASICACNPSHDARWARLWISSMGFTDTHH
ncbi:hypothetical protein [Xanthomonas phage JGB6]|nr:hypothetical protein [Xanthomonas phage JGB6]